MPVIAIFAGPYCSAEEVAQKAAERMDLPLVGEEVIERAAKMSGITTDKLGRALAGSASFFNNLTHGREKGLAYLRAALAEELGQESLVYRGPLVHLIPRSITHVLRVAVVADPEHRAAVARELDGLTAREAEKRIKAADEGLRQWVHFLMRKSPWDPALYDVRIPMQSTTVDRAVELVCESALKPALKPNEASLQAALDFQLATRVLVALVGKGHHYCEVEASGADVTVVINKNVLRLEALERDLKRIATSVEGVDRVQTRVGPKYNSPDIIRRFDFDMPTSKFLLVDDEKEYVMTLSERLEMRDFESDVAYDGQEALRYVDEHEPDVMVLDLRMPGIGGIDVLRRIKQEHPAVEVIILTGHGTEKDRQMAEELGAFAYLQKPVDIDVLARTMKEAQRKARGEAVEPQRDETEETE